MYAQAYALGVRIVPASQSTTPKKISLATSCTCCRTPLPPPPKHEQVLKIYVKGSCKGNHDLNQNNRTAIGKFAWRTSDDEWATYSVEVTVNPTNERAVLQAVLDALSKTFYQYTRWTKIIIISYDQYLVAGMNSGYQNWVKTGWKLSHRKPRPNRAYWDAIMSMCQEHQRNGIQIECLQITKQQFNLLNIF